MNSNQEVQTETTKVNGSNTNNTQASILNSLKSAFANKSSRAKGSKNPIDIIATAQNDLKSLLAYLPKLINCSPEDFVENLLAVVPNTSTKARHLMEGIAKKLERVSNEVSD